MTDAIVCRPAIAVPDHVLTREGLRETMRDVLGPGFPHLRRLLQIVEHSGIERRHLVRPLADTLRGDTFGERNAIFARESVRLAERAARDALAAAGVAAAAVDLLISTSCTGIMIPSVCAYLLPALGCRPDTKRLPITELGCAAGTVALSRAREFVAAHPQATVLVVAHELCSLTYQCADRSMQAMVGAMLFGDGAAAAVVRDASAANVTGLRLQANASHLFPDSLGYMGFDVRESGLHLVLDKGIPGAVEREIRPVIEAFLARQGMTRDDLDFFCLHPGGRKVLDELARVFTLEPDALRASRDCLAEVGNLSSASILVVLRNFFDRYRPRPGARGLVTAFGPGFSAEMLVGTWQEAA